MRSTGPLLTLDPKGSYTSRELPLDPGTTRNVRSAGDHACTLATCAALGGPGVTPARAASRPCAMWLEPTSDRENIVWPEMTTTYESGLVPIPPGGWKMRLYKHER